MIQTEATINRLQGMGTLEMTKIHILHQKTQIAQATTTKGRQLPVRRVMIGCLTHNKIHLASPHILMIIERDSISLHNISGTASTLHLNIQSVLPDFAPLLLNLLTIIRILIILATNTLLQGTVNTISHPQMHIACRRHLLRPAIHMHQPITMQHLKHLHHVSELQSHANTVARERLVPNTHNSVLHR
jgi:hypothetical protein